ncbi:had-superfamily subfamily iia [Chrysochromulina tobinii]|uniref:Had-superfamily subfamily iia n=1 Tax=Chrysochromulina tobinii TaxID=1460289 RepID=A0A0M0JM09_9EUKA|nr:had-superfamily subfamily iia [Chrysochromulina tobinii]|eukprot:KOO27505.1 had-superfamily subfamily iia [Chrysochromulina sp. CCMP291]
MAMTKAEDEKIGNVVENDEWLGLATELAIVFQSAVRESINANVADFIGKDDYKLGDVSKEADARIKGMVADLRGKDEYELGYLSIALDTLVKEEVWKMTGKEKYEFGDLSTVLDTRVKRTVADFCGKVQRSSKSLPDLAELKAAEKQASIVLGAAAAKEAKEVGPTRQYDPALSRITGFLIDLDGTVYRPNSLMPGASDFHEWMLSTGKQFVYLSNTGAKASEAVRRKLSSPSYYVGEKLPPDCVWTAADAQVEFMADNIPVGAKVFVVSGACGDFWLPLLRERCPALVDTWEIRTEMSETEAKQWATIAATNPNTPLVWVVMFIDGKLGSCNDPTTGEPSPADWSYEYIRKLLYLLGHGEHQLTMQSDYKQYVPTFVARSIGAMHGLEQTPELSPQGL